MKRLAILTSGGDAPGMNAAIRAVARTALGQNIAPYAVYRGYEGLINGEIEPMTTLSVSGIINRGGTILRTSRCERFKTPEGQKTAAEALNSYKIDGLVVIGGDGSMRGACALNELTGIKVAGLPGTIDNDIPGTDYSIGFDTAINTALGAIDRIRDTAHSHERVFVIEVMGRNNGHIAIEVAISGGAEAALIPEIELDMAGLSVKLDEWQKRGKRSCIVVVAEGAHRATDVEKFLRSTTGCDVRAVVLGYTQRGGSPTAFDRSLATRLGAYAVSRLIEGHSNEMAGIAGSHLCSVPISYVQSGSKPVDPERVRLVESMAL